MNKTILLLLLTTSILSSNAQPKFVKATSQGWAGGMCCRQGTNYVITISGTKKELEKLKVTSVCIGNMKFDSPHTTISNYNNDLNASLIINCNYSYDSHEEDLNNEPQTVPEKCDELCVIYKTPKKKGKILITNVEALGFIAYP